MGHSGEFDHARQGLLLNPGTYKVKLVPVNGAAGKQQEVTIQADKTTAGPTD